MQARRLATKGVGCRFDPASATASQVAAINSYAHVDVRTDADVELRLEEALAHDTARD